MIGTISWFSLRKGYGFISDDDGNHYFVHYTDLNMPNFKVVYENDIVDFELKEDGDGRIHAVNVTPILTTKMVSDALSEYDLFLNPVHVDGYTKYLVVNENNVIQSPEHGMTLLEAAEYAELDVSGI